MFEDCEHQKQRACIKSSVSSQHTTYVTGASVPQKCFTSASCSFVYSIAHGACSAEKVTERTKSFCVTIEHNESISSAILFVPRFLSLINSSVSAPLTFCTCFRLHGHYCSVGASNCMVLKIWFGLHLVSQHFFSTACKTSGCVLMYSDPPFLLLP